MHKRNISLDNPGRKIISIFSTRHPIWKDPRWIRKHFWNRVKIGKPNECWPWLAGSKIVGGYGTLTVLGVSHPAHRFAYELTYGKPDYSKDCCHKCDNPPCCNPKHLFMGTVAENILDCMAKGRTRGAVGERNYGAKLTPKQVLKIRKLWATGRFTQPMIANKYGLCRMQANRIIIRRAWKHI